MSFVENSDIVRCFLVIVIFCCANTTAFHMPDCNYVRRKFSWGVSFSGLWWSFVFDVRCLWRHDL